MGVYVYTLRKKVRELPIGKAVVAEYAYKPVRWPCSDASAARKENAGARAADAMNDKINPRNRLMVVGDPRAEPKYSPHNENPVYRVKSFPWGFVEEPPESNAEYIGRVYSRKVNGRWKHEFISDEDVKRADAILREVSAMSYFDELVNKGADHGYRPTLRPDIDGRNVWLADFYDRYMEAIGSELRAFRG